MQMKTFIEKQEALENISGLVDTMSICTSVDMCLGMKSMKSSVLSEIESMQEEDAVLLSEVNEKVDEVLAVLNAIRSGGRINYSDYSELFDAIMKIPESEAVEND